MPDGQACHDEYIEQRIRPTDLVPNRIDWWIIGPVSQFHDRGTSDLIREQVHESQNNGRDIQEKNQPFPFHQE